MPGSDEKVKAQVALEINKNRPVAEKLQSLLDSGDKDTLSTYTKLLFDQARLIEGLPVEDPLEFSKAICNLM